MAYFWTQATPSIQKIDEACLCLFHQVFFLYLFLKLYPFSLNPRDKIKFVSYYLGVLFFLSIAFGGFEDMIIGWNVDEREGEGSIRVPIYPVRTLIVIFALISAFVYGVLLVHFLSGGEAITEEEEGKHEAVSGSQI